MVIDTLSSTLKIQPSELRMATLLGTLFALVQLGCSVGGSAADAIFFKRFGVNHLPNMYLILGGLNFTALIGYFALLGRWTNKGRLFTSLFTGFAGVLLAERLAIVSNVREVHPLLWLSVNILSLLLGILLWSTAGEICDTRQAKRLFPLFASAGIFGWLIGSLLTGPVARVFGTENLIVLDVVVLIAATLVLRTITSRFFPRTQQGTAHANIMADLRAGYDLVRQSPMLQLLGSLAVLFSVLYFAVAFPFGKSVAAAFSSEADMAGYLGLFSGVTSAIALVVSLLFANRLYARVGIVAALLLLPITYLLGFAVLTVNFTLLTATIVRFSQTVILNGIGDGAYNSFFNIVPPAKRAQVRTVVSGVPSQLGIVLSGIMLVLGQQVLTMSQIFLMGIAVAGLCIVVVWALKARHAEALVAALRAGRFDVFARGKGALRGVRGDAAATAVVVSALRDLKPTTRRLAAEMLGHMGASSSSPALIASLGDPDAEVRAAALRALGMLEAHTAANAVMQLVTDPQPSVRAAVLNALMRLKPPPSAKLTDSLKGLLQDDQPSLRIQAAELLIALDQAAVALPVLQELLHHPDPSVRALVVTTIGQVVVDEPTPTFMTAALDDESPIVRRAACGALAGNHQEWSTEALLRCLHEQDSTVRAAASRALRQHSAATPRLLQILAEEHGVAQESALAALLPNGVEQTVTLRAFAASQIEALENCRSLAATLPSRGSATKFLRKALEARASSCEQRLVTVIGLLGNPTIMELVSNTLHTADTQIRAAAVDALETLGDKQLIKQVVPLLDRAPVGPSAIADGPASAATIRRLLANEDTWICALAARAAGEMDLQDALRPLRALATHTSPLIQAAAHDARMQLQDGDAMQTLQTVSLMERILLLHEVPLFADLLPDDLMQIAEIAYEQLFSNGAVICGEGDQGNELFIIISGKLRVLKNRGDKARVLAVRETGDVVGEMAIIEAAPRFATIQADGEARVLSIGGDAFKTILRDRPDVSFEVMRSLSRRLRESS